MVKKDKLISKLVEID